LVEPMGLLKLLRAEVAENRVQPTSIVEPLGVEVCPSLIPGAVEDLVSPLPLPTLFMLAWIPCSFNSTW